MRLDNEETKVTLAPANKSGIDRFAYEKGGHHLVMVSTGEGELKVEGNEVESF